MFIKATVFDRSTPAGVGREARINTRNIASYTDGSIEVFHPPVLLNGEEVTQSEAVPVTYVDYIFPPGGHVALCPPVSEKLDAVLATVDLNLNTKEVLLP